MVEAVELARLGHHLNLAQCDGQRLHRRLLQANGEQMATGDTMTHALQFDLGRHCLPFPFRILVLQG